MSQIEGNDQPVEDSATSPADHGKVGIDHLSDAGVGVGAGEPNTFEPEEAAPAADEPAD